MYCRYCGALNAEHAATCAQCGQSLVGPIQQPHAQPVHGAGAQTSGLAIGSLIASVVGLAMCPFIGGIIGVVLGNMAMNEIRASGGAVGGEGLARAGIIVGWISAVIGILTTLCLGAFLMAQFSMH